MPERVGILGLGRMGRPVAAAVRDAGYPVVAHDPAAEPLAGVTRLADPLGVVAAADVLLTILPGAGAAASLAQVLPALTPGALWVDLTSNDPRLAQRLAQTAPQAASVAAPMGGGPSAARSRTIEFTVSGNSDAVARALPVLTSAGSVTVVGSDPGAAHLVHLLANQLWFGQAVAVAEALLLADSAGLDLTIVRSALAAGAGGSAFLQRDLDALLAGDYLETFGIDRVVEELDIAASIAEEAGVPHDVADLIAALHRQALERFGPIDGELLAVRLLEERAGRVIRAS